MAIVEGQKVKVNWSGSNKKHFESFGYIFENGKEFEVDVEELPRFSRSIIKVYCDYCLDKGIKTLIEKEYQKYNYIMDRSVKKVCCEECKYIKTKELRGALYELEYEEIEDEIKPNGYTKEHLINEFYRFKEEFGYYPQLVDMKANSDFPGASGYTKNWGTWSNFLKDIGILGNCGLYKEDEVTIKKLYPKPNTTMREINDRLIDKKSIYELTKIIKKLGLEERDLFVKRIYEDNLSKEQLFYISINDLHNDLGDIPTAIDYDKYTKINKLPSRRFIENKIKKAFSKICIEIFNSSNKTIKSDEELIDELIQLKNKLGRVPLGSELKTHGLAEHKAYSRRFNMGYQELIESLGWELSSTQTVKVKDNESLLADYERLRKELGRLPNSLDLQDCEYTSSYGTYRKYFGSLKSVWDILDLEYEVNQALSGGIVSLNKNNEICRSNAELEISNILIDSSVSYVPELKYSLLDDSLPNKWVMDWYLKDKNIYVEYFGMYDESHLKRNSRIGKYSRKVKKKINYCLNNNIKLISLYSDDLKNNYKGLRNKFREQGIVLNI